jgi:hypothetical protein
VDLIKPQELTVKTLDGEEKTFVISRFPAIAGREIIAGYPLTGMPKIGEYKSNEAIMLKLMSFVAVTMPNGELLRLRTQALIDNHVPDCETLMRIEFESLKYNTSFFRKGEISTFLGTIAKKAAQLISPTLTPLLEQLSEAVKQRSANFKQNTI